MKVGLGRQYKQTPWPQSARELHQPSDRRLSAKLVSIFADRGESRGQRNGSSRPYSRFSRPEPLCFLPSSSSIVLSWLSGPRSRTTIPQKIRERRDLWNCSQKLWPLDHRRDPKKTIWIRKTKSLNFVGVTRKCRENTDRISEFWPLQWRFLCSVALRVSWWSRPPS
jgi:hypothetical protein